MRGWWKRLQPAGQREAAVGACLAHAALRVSNFTLDGLRPARVHPGRTDGRRAFFLFFKQCEERLNQSKALLSFFFFFFKSAFFQRRLLLLRPGATLGRTHPKQTSLFGFVWSPAPDPPSSFSSTTSPFQTQTYYYPPHNKLLPSVSLTVASQMSLGGGQRAAGQQIDGFHHRSISTLCARSAY